MPCCKTQEYGNWCRNENVLEVDGKEYCIFHAPQGKKGITLEEFNQKVFDEINETSRSYWFGHFAKMDDNTFQQKDSYICNLFGTVFEGDISFSPWEQNFITVDFTSSVFHGIVEFSSITFEKLIVNNVVFMNDVSFIGFNFMEDISFLETKFHKKIDFTDAQFISARFARKSFAKDSELIFRPLFIKDKIIFKDVSFKNMKAFFKDTDLRQCRFVQCQFKEKKDGRYFFDDESEIDEAHHLDSLEISKIESLYRAQKQRSKEDHNEFEASKWHISEKEMTMKSAVGFNKLMLWLYKLASGFGENPLQAFIFLGTLIILFVDFSSFFFPLMGELSSYNVAKQSFRIILNTLQIASFQKETILDLPKTSIIAGFIKLSAQIFIPIQAALFAFALRNKFRR